MHVKGYSVDYYFDFKVKLNSINKILLKFDQGFKFFEAKKL